MSTAGVGQQNPFSDSSDFNALQFVIARYLDKIQTVSIVQVKAVNTGAQTVDVLVLVNLITGAGTSVPHGVISARPYFRLQGGSSGIICDPTVGDIGIMVFGSRDLSAVIAAKAAANPGSARKFSWSDGMYFGGLLNASPTQYLQFLASGGGVNLTTPGDFTVTAAAASIMAASTTMSGTLEVTGLSTLTGGVTAPTGSIAALEVTSISPISGSTISFPAGSIADTALVPSGVTPGTYLSTNLTVNAAGIITAAANGSGGGGGGTVTSVGISTPGIGVVVGGGPITTAGTLTVDLSTAAYAALALAVTALQPVTGLSGSYTNANLTINSSGQITAVANGSGGGAVSSVSGGSSAVTVTPTTGAVVVDLSSTSKSDLALAATSVQSVGAGSADIVIGGTSTAPTVDLSATVKTDVGLAATAVQPGAIQNLESAGWNSTAAIVVTNTVPQDIVIPYACTLREVIILTQGPAGSSVSGSCVVDMAHTAFAGFPGSLTDMTGGVPPAISSSSAPYDNTTFTGWTVTTFAQNDVIRCTLASNASFASVKIILRMY